MLNFIYMVLMRGITFYRYILILYALLTWFPQAYQSRFFDWVEKISRPYLSIFDRFLGPVAGVSFSVIFGLFGLTLVQMLIANLFNLFR